MSFNRERIVQQILQDEFARLTEEIWELPLTHESGSKYEVLEAARGEISRVRELGIRGGMRLRKLELVPVKPIPLETIRQEPK